MIPVLIRSTARSALLLFAVAVLVFAATELLPGDAVQARTRGRAGEVELARLREQAGLDDPAWQRFGGWLSGFLHGDAGRSLINDRPVSVLVAERLPATLALTAAALLIAVPLMLLAAWVAGSTRLGSPASGVIAAAAAVPQVVVAGALVALFSGLLHWLPRVSLLPIGQSPWQRPELLVLPTLSLALPAAAFGAGLLAGAVADVRRLPHVEDAVLRGVPHWRVAVRHVLPLLTAPLLHVLAVIYGGLIAATTVVETVFGYNGLGELLVSSVANRDVPTVQAVALLSAAVVLAGLWLADVVRGGTA
ncbi:ABC transporter permease [Saccharopolyspora shandongensis]|uniref:ABC transporter permease n=1 Tax=Saccharopolyspora shandongensis TaxID=418495 RepID=UPI0034019CA7